MELHLPRDGADRATTRRRFLAGAAGITGGAVASRILARERSGQDESYESIAAGSRSYSALRYFLQVDGGDIGQLVSYSGGAISAPVVQGVTVEHYKKKHIGAKRHENIVMTCGLGMGREMYQMISRALNGNPDSISGEIVGVDSDNKVRSRLLFSDAQIVDVTFPTLDASSKKTLTIEVTLAPQLTGHPAAGGQPPSRTGTSASALVSSYRLRLGALPTARVTKIEGLEVNVPVGLDPVVDFPELSLEISNADVGPWRAWFESFVVDGQSTDAHELDGEIDLMSSDFKQVLARITLNNVGIFRFAPADATGTDQIKRFRVRLYNEFMGFVFRPDEEAP